MLTSDETKYSLENQFFLAQARLQLEGCDDLGTLREMVIALVKHNLVYKQIIKEGLKF